jgi:hypothetical protein
MVIEPFVRMGPPPRSLASEANDCFMVRLLRGANRIQGCGAIFARYGGLPSDRWQATAGPRPKSWRPAHPPYGMAIRYVTKNRACRQIANPMASTPSATPNDRLDIALAARPSNRSPRSVTVGRRTDGPELSVGTTPSPGWSRCKLSISVGMMRCPTACAKVPPPRPFDLDLDALIAIVPPRGYGRD